MEQLLSDDDTFLQMYKGTGIRPAHSVEPPAQAALDPRHQLTDPSRYRPSGDCRDAVNVALQVGLPLLISGEPGSGKTQLGYAVAYELGLEAPELFVTKSTTEARDLFYRYDALGHFRASHIGSAQDASAFIQLGPLGRAIDNALETAILGRGSADGKRQPRRSVVIIDEIDKAPRDFPNDLLYEIEHLTFRIPELGLTSPAVPDHFRPIVLITTNAEQGLPEAFLRRCAFVHLSPPAGEELAELLERRFEEILRRDHKLVRDVLRLWDSARGNVHLERPPSSAELLQFVGAILQAGGRPDMALADQPFDVKPFVAILAKSAEDAQRLRVEVGQPA